MIEINKYKLNSLITPWGEIHGDIRDQKDLVAFIQDRMGVTMEEVQEWVNSQNFLTEHQDISNLATKEEVEEVDNKIPSLDGYATEEWVEDKGYLTEHQEMKTINGENITGTGNIEIGGLTPEQEEKIAEIDNKADKTEIPSLDGYATEQWVEDKGYLTEHQDISNLATKTEVEDVEKSIPSLDGYATEKYVSDNYVEASTFDKNMDDINAEMKQKLESGDFKTINGENIVGSGNIVVGGGGSSKQTFLIHYTIDYRSHPYRYTCTDTVEHIESIKQYLLINGKDSADLYFVLDEYLEDMDMNQYLRVTTVQIYTNGWMILYAYDEGTTGLIYYPDEEESIRMTRDEFWVEHPVSTINGISVMSENHNFRILTDQEISDLNPILHPSDGVPTYKSGIEGWQGSLWFDFEDEVPAFPSDYYSHVFSIERGAYYIDTVNGVFYEFSKGVNKPMFTKCFQDDRLIDNNNVLWKDKTGRMWLGTSYLIIGDKDNIPSDIQEFNIGGEYLGNFNRCNIVEMPNNIYMIGSSKKVYRFDEGGMQFVDTGVSTTSWTTFNQKLGTNTPKFTQYMFEIDGNKVLTGGTSSASLFRFRLTETIDAESGEYNLGVVQLATNTYFPATLRHGQSTVYPQGCYIHKNTDGQYYYLQGAYVTKLTRMSSTSGMWQTSKSAGIANFGWSGAELLDQFLGANTQSGFQIFNAKDSDMYSYWESQEYATKSYVDSILGSLDDITNQILS